MAEEVVVVVLLSEEVEEGEWRRWWWWLDMVEEAAEGEEGDRVNFSSLLQNVNVDYMWQGEVMGSLAANMAGQVHQAQVT